MNRSTRWLTFVLALAVIAVLAGIAQQSGETVTCPVSGKVMKKADAPASVEYQGTTYYFCCEDCKAKFLENPEKYTQTKPEAGAKYVCPMCKGVESDKPGKCPKCGMELVKKAEAAPPAAAAAMPGCGREKTGEGGKKTCLDAESAKGSAAGCGKSCGKMKMGAMGGEMKGACPICSPDVDFKVENVKDGVVLTLTAKTPELVKALQDTMAKMKGCRAKCREVPEAAKKEEPKK